jgi:hypothetical protein
VRPGDRDALRAVTVTLEELGAPTDPAVVAEALVDGFRCALDVEFSPSPGAWSHLDLGSTSR